MSRILLWQCRGESQKDLDRRANEANVADYLVFAADPTKPLGPRPVCLSEPLFSYWLTPDERKKLKGAENVGRGMAKLLRCTEAAIVRTAATGDGLDFVLRLTKSYLTMELTSDQKTALDMALSMYDALSDARPGNG